MKVLNHHIYEYRKGLRNLVLHTMKAEEILIAIAKLEKLQIPYYLQEVTPSKVNVFFGKLQCVEIVKSFGKKTLSNFTDEEDFILGILLVYDRILQSERYLKRISERRKGNFHSSVR